MRICLTVAGSDSGGGAGIQADLKTFHANGVFGASVVTAITAQNTVEVTRAMELPADLVRAQFEAVCSDLQVAAIKTGMLATPGMVETVADLLSSFRSGWATAARPPLVVDPVMVSKSGFALLAPEAVETVRRRLVPLASVVTPNHHEAELLAGIQIESRADVERAGARILELGAHAVLVKGGHLAGPGLDPTRAIDFLFERDGKAEFSSERVETRATHGTGCTYSAAICAGLARGLPLREAIAAAKRYVTGAIRHGLSIGRGHGPTHHFYFLDDPAELHG